MPQHPDQRRHPDPGERHGESPERTDHVLEVALEILRPGKIVLAVGGVAHDLEEIGEGGAGSDRRRFRAQIGKRGDQGSRGEEGEQAQPAEGPAQGGEELSDGEGRELAARDQDLLGEASAARAQFETRSAGSLPAGAVGAESRAAGSAAPASQDRVVLAALEEHSTSIVPR